MFSTCLWGVLSEKFTSSVKTKMRAECVKTIFFIPYVGLPSTIFAKKRQQLIKDNSAIKVRAMFTTFKVKNYFSLKYITSTPLRANVCRLQISMFWVIQTRPTLAMQNNNWPQRWMNITKDIQLYRDIWMNNIPCNLLCCYKVLAYTTMSSFHSWSWLCDKKKIYILSTFKVITVLVSKLKTCRYWRCQFCLWWKLLRMNSGSNGSLLLVHFTNSEIC